VYSECCRPAESFFYPGVASKCVKFGGGARRIAPRVFTAAWRMNAPRSKGGSCVTHLLQFQEISVAWAAFQNLDLIQQSV
jgi:hypothetical protein